MRDLLSLLVVVVGTAAGWWLSSYDTRVTGENERVDFIRRAIRSGVTFILLTIGAFGGVLFVPIAVILAVIWASCGAEFLSQQFHKLVDPEDKRSFDPKEVERKLDLLARFVREGRSGEALDLCKSLGESGEASPLAIEATLYRLYQEILDSIPISDFLVEARRLRVLGQFEQAELELKRLLAQAPGSLVARLLLMRVYAQDLARPDKALALIEPADKQPPLHPAFITYAKRSIDEWSRDALNKQQAKLSVGGDSAEASSSTEVIDEIPIDELLKSGQLATAIESLEKVTTEEPQNFDAWLKLAEAHAVYCADVNRASKIIRKMELSAKFTPEETERAKAKLKEWQTARRS